MSPKRIPLAVEDHSKPPLSPFQQFVGKWKDCNLCELAYGRNHIVLCRGSIPADVVFVGEAPGESEDLAGAPFKGPAGYILQDIIDEAVPGSVKYALTNMVCCIPRGEDGRKTREPEESYIMACKPRLEEFLQLAQPKLLVAVGQVATDYLSPGYRWSVKLPYDVPRLDIIHPSAILRQPVIWRGLSQRRCIVQIRNAIHDYVLSQQ